MATRRRERGGALIETAVVAGFLVLLLLGLAAFGTVLSASIKSQTAAREGARVAALGGSNDQIVGSVMRELTKSGKVADVPGQAAVGITPVDPNARLFNTTVKVEVWWRVPIRVPLVGLLFRDRELYASNTEVVTVAHP